MIAPRCVFAPQQVRLEPEPAPAPEPAPRYAAERELFAGQVRQLCRAIAERLDENPGETAYAVLTAASDGAAPPRFAQFRATPVEIVLDLPLGAFREGERTRLLAERRGFLQAADFPALRLAPGPGRAFDPLCKVYSWREARLLGEELFWLFYLFWELPLAGEVKAEVFTNEVAGAAVCERGELTLRLRHGPSTPETNGAAIFAGRVGTIPPLPGLCPACGLPRQPELFERGRPAPRPVRHSLFESAPDRRFGTAQHKVCGVCSGLMERWLLIFEIEDGQPPRARNPVRTGRATWISEQQVRETGFRNRFFDGLLRQRYGLLIRRHWHLLGLSPEELSGLN